MPGQTVVPSAIGIMSTALPSLKFMIQAMLSTEPWRRDPEVVPIPWREDQTVAPKTKLCFAALPFDGVVWPHPPIQRGMNMMTRVLQDAGHTVCQPIHKISTHYQG